MNFILFLFTGLISFLILLVSFNIKPKDDQFFLIEFEPILFSNSSERPNQNHTSYTNSSVIPEKKIDSADYTNQQCPNWSFRFTEKFNQVCSFWLDKYQDWQLKVNHARSVSFWCSSPVKCHGWGDRLAGVVTAFLRAIDMNYQFQIGHPGLNSLFHPCLFNTTYTNWRDNNEFINKKRDDCVFDESNRCSSWLNMKCEIGSLVAKNVDRTCVSRRICNEIVQTVPNFTAANLIGCHLRANFELSNYFLKQARLPFKIHNQVHDLSLFEIENFFKENFVISIQMRLGDSAFKGEVDNYLAREQRHLIRPFRCATTIESLLLSDKSYEGKKVYWFLATDSRAFKQMAEITFGNKLISFDFQPEHLSSHHTSKEIEQELGEWYVLGLGRELIVNKMDFSDIWHGRVSGYAKTSWVYHLNYLIHDAATCRKYPIPFDGNWKYLGETGCLKSTIFKQPTPQDHLLPLIERNLSFPKYFIFNGQVILDQFSNFGVSKDIYEQEKI